MKKNICYVLLLIVLLIFIPNLTSFSIVSETINSRNNSLSDENSFLALNNKSDTFKDFLLEYADILISYANKSNEGWSWKRVLNFDNNWAIAGLYQFHPGYFFGAAGIGDQFIQLYKITDNTTYLAVAQHAADYILNNVIELTGSDGNVYLHWTRAVGSNTVYTGFRYGYAGIIKFLLNLYKQTNNQTYLTFSSQSIDSLIYYSKHDSSNRIYWGYNIYQNNGFTGYTYGTSGIGETLLDAYLLTNNLTYLEIAEKSVSWILNHSLIVEEGGTDFYAVLASNDGGYDNNFTGLFTGSAGVGRYFDKLYEITHNQTYLSYSKAIGNWLIGVMQDGYWNFGSVDFLTETLVNEEGHFNGYASGSAGIGSFFLDLYNKTHDSNYLYPVNRIYTALSEQAINDTNSIYWKAQEKGSWIETIFTGLGFGVAGVGKFFSGVLEYFGDYKDTENYLLGINNYFLTIRDNETHLLPYKIPADDNIIQYRSDFFDGIAGVLDFYISAYYSFTKQESLYLPSLLSQATTYTWDVPFPTSIYISSTSFSTSIPTKTTPTSDFSFFNIVNFSLFAIGLLFIVMKRKKVKR